MAVRDESGPRFLLDSANYLMPRLLKAACRHFQPVRVGPNRLRLDEVHTMLRQIGGRLLRIELEAHWYRNYIISIYTWKSLPVVIGLGFSVNGGQVAPAATIWASLEHIAPLESDNLATLPTVIRAEYRRGHHIRLTFNDGSQKTADFSGWLNGPVFEPLKDEAYFRRFFIDGGTVAWPNGADIAPETLYESRAADEAA
jgi:hypothetical protein